MATYARRSGTKKSTVVVGATAAHPFEVVAERRRQVGR
jgi:hypothetical protein